jgi:hypothetical protein
MAAFVAVVLLGATTSSIGISSLRQDPQAPLGFQIGESSHIRADEYNAFSPIVLSIMATGDVPSTSPLAASADLVHRYSSGGFFSSVVFFDSTLLRSAVFLPDGMVFAAHWWLPALLLFLFLPTWFAQIGASRRWGWLAATLIALAPATSWWTMMPVQLIAYTVAGSSLLLASFAQYQRRNRPKAVLCGFAAGILLAGMPSFYIPWSLVLGLPVLAASVVGILAARSEWAPKLLALGTAGFVAAGFAAGMLWENRAGIDALLHTVYPGSRRAGGSSQDFNMVFGAPVLGAMRDATPLGSNESEMSTAYTVTFVWAAVLIVGLVALRPLRGRAALLTIGAFGLVWLVWCTVDFGELGAMIPLLNYVTPGRAAQVCGILGTLLVCLLLSCLKGNVGWKAPVAAALACGLVTAYAGSELKQQYLPSLTTTGIASAALAVALCVLLVTRFHARAWPLVLTAALAVVPVVGTNPLMFGLGDLRVSSTATYLREAGSETRSHGGLWASDSPAFDNVAFSNGVPSLTGIQRSGPDAAAWSRLDPGQSHSTEWNRGGGFIYFQWTEDAQVGFGNNGSDSAVVRIDPCVLKSRIPETETIASTRPLSSPCLLPGAVLPWSGQDMHLYTFR